MILNFTLSAVNGIRGVDKGKSEGVGPQDVNLRTNLWIDFPVK